MLRIDRGCFVTVVDSELTVDNDEDARMRLRGRWAVSEHEVVSPYKAIFGLCCGCWCQTRRRPARYLKIFLSPTRICGETGGVGKWLIPPPPSLGPEASLASRPKLGRRRGLVRWETSWTCICHVIPDCTCAKYTSAFCLSHYIHGGPTKRSSIVQTCRNGR